MPSELIAHPQWVYPRYVERGEGKQPDKQPIHPHAAQCWRSLAEHLDRHWHGLTSIVQFGHDAQLTALVGGQDRDYTTERGRGVKVVNV